MSNGTLDALGSSDSGILNGTETQHCDYETSTGLCIRCIVHNADNHPELSEQNLVGVIIAIAANAVIPIALNLQKYAHERNKGPDGKPLRPFVKIPTWWMGLILMVTGEFFNLLAYGYAPTSLVAPVGAVGVFFNGIITTTCMDEKFTKKDALGLSMIAGGVVMVVSAVPGTQIDLTSELIWNKILPDPRAWGYFLFVFVVVSYWLVMVLPKYKKTHVLVYLVLCSLISSVTVVSSRAFSSIVTNLVGTAVEGVPQWQDLRYPQVVLFSLIIIAVTAIWSTAYLNEAMMHFGNNEVVPVYYTTFTLASVTGGALVYSEFQCLTYSNTIVFFLGCLCTFAGVFFVASAHKGEASSEATRAETASEPSSAPRAPRQFRTGVRLIDSPFEMATPSPGGLESGPALGVAARPRGTGSPNYRPELPWGGIGDMGRTMHGGMQSTMMGSLNHAGALHMCSQAVRRTWRGAPSAPVVTSHAVQAGGGQSESVGMGIGLEDMGLGSMQANLYNGGATGAGKPNGGTASPQEVLSVSSKARDGGCGSSSRPPPMPASLAAEPDLDPTEIRMSTTISLSSGPPSDASASTGTVLTTPSVTPPETVFEERSGGREEARAEEAAGAEAAAAAQREPPRAPPPTHDETAPETR